MDNRDDKRDADEVRLDELLEKERADPDGDKNEQALSKIDRIESPTSDTAPDEAAQSTSVPSSQNTSADPTPSSMTAGSTDASRYVAQSDDTENDDSNKTKFKKYFLYTLVAGLIICALISVIAVLVGEFNSAMAKAFGTTVSMVAHTVILLFFLSNVTRKSNMLIVNTLQGITALSFATSLLGIWGILDSQITGDLYLLYFYTLCLSIWSQLLLFVGENLLDKLTRFTSKVAIGFSILFYLLLLPTIFVHGSLPEYLFRGIAATAIVLATASVLCAVFRRIYIAKNHIKSTDPSLHSGIDIAIALIALFIGIPVIFAMMASTAYRDYDDSSYESSYESSPSPSPEAEEESSTYDVKDCSKMQEYATNNWTMSKYVYYYQNADPIKRTLTFGQSAYGELVTPKQYDSSLVVVDADCKPYSFEDIETGDAVSYYSPVGQAGRPSEMIFMLQAVEEYGTSSDDRQAEPIKSST